jgi:hypothetical protein
VNSDKIDVQLPSLICEPTIARHPNITPATVSLSNFIGDYLLAPGMAD